MEQRYESSPREVERMNTKELRENFLAENLFAAGEANFVYSHYDRMVMGGVIPTSGSITLGNYEELKSDFFLQRREVGILNTGGTGEITADGKSYTLDKLSCLYLGRGTKEVTFTSSDANDAAKFFIQRKMPCL